MGSRKEATQLVKALRAQGFEVELNGGNHWSARRNGRFITTFAQTPSDPRGLKNAIARLKKAGYRP